MSDDACTAHPNECDNSIDKEAEAANKEAWANYSARHVLSGSVDKWAAFGDAFDLGVAYERARAAATVAPSEPKPEAEPECTCPPTDDASQGCLPDCPLDLWLNRKPEAVRLTDAEVIAAGREALSKIGTALMFVVDSEQLKVAEAGGYKGLHDVLDELERRLNRG